MSLAPGRPSQPNFQRPSSGGNPAEMGAGGASTIQRNSSSNNNFMSNANAGGRKSQAFFGTATPAAPHTSSLQLGQSTQRRSSVWSSARQSSSMGQAGGGHQSFFTTAPAPAGVPRDPRPLREKTFQGQIAKELMDYLTQNNFEMDMKHSLTQNSLKSPTQKDFNNMFQWLYGRIDPNYRFYRSIDQEVPPILKQLRYPFEKNITRSQIAAVGGANWPSFLGVLHWMMQLARMMEGYNTGSYDDACIDAGYDITGDRIIFDFLTDAYHEWLAMEDDQEDKADEILRPHVNRMARQFDDANSKYVEQVKVLEAEHRALRDQVEELSRSGDLIAKLDKDHKTLADDKVKFDTFKSTMHEKQEKYEGRVNLIKNEIEKVEQEMEEVEQKRSELQAEVDKQGMTIDDIDRMNSERERLQKGVESTAQRLEDAKQKVSEKENDAGSRLDDLERSVLEYNGLGYQIGIIPATAANAKGGDYELSLKISTQTAPSSFRSSRSRSQSRQRSRASESPSPECQTIEERLLADSSTGYAPHQLLNLDIRGVVKNGITGLRKEVAEKKNASAETDLNNRDLLDKIREAIEDKQQEVEGLGHRVRAAEEEFEKTRDVWLHLFYQFTCKKQANYQCNHRSLHHRRCTPTCRLKSSRKISRSCVLISLNRCSSWSSVR